MLRYKKYIWFVFVVFYLGCICLSEISSQKPELKYKRLMNETGLEPFEAWSIMQDSKGFIWLGTQDGLFRYDGVEYKAYSNDPADSNSLCSNAVFRVLEDRNKNLWICTNRGVDRYDRLSDKFIHYPIYLTLQEANEIYHSTDTVFYSLYASNIRESKSGDLYIFSSYQCTYKIDFITNRIVKFTTPYSCPEEKKILEATRDIAEDNNGNIWISSDFGLYVYNPTTQKTHYYNTDTKDITLPGNEVRSILYHDNTMWCATYGGIIAINTNEYAYKIYKSHKDKPYGLGSNIAWYLYLDSDENLWAGMNEGGLCLYDPKIDDFYAYKNDPEDPSSLFLNDVLEVYEDKQGNLWLSLGPGGNAVTNIRYKNQFISYVPHPEDKNSLPCGLISGIMKDKGNNLWVTTDCMGFVRIDAKTNEYQHFYNEPGKAELFGGNKFLYIYETNDGKFWVAGYHTGLNEFNYVSKKNKIFSVTGDNKGISYDDIRCICETQDGRLWIATNGGGINIYDRETETFTYLISNPYDKNNSLCSNNCLLVVEDAIHNLWFGTYLGVSIYDPKTKTIKNLISKSGDTTTISNNWIYSMLAEPNGDMWIGTHSGLNFYEAKTEKITRITRKEGLPNDVINGILKDEKGNLWLATSYGLVVYNPMEGIKKHYTISNGLLSNHFYHGAYYKDNSGRMYFGTNTGLIAFYPDQIQVNMEKPKVYITDLQHYYKSFPIGVKGSPLKANIIDTDEVILKHNQSQVLTFKYTGISFINSEENQFKYKLENFEKEWNNVGSKREATYTNLDPGTYYFRVIASNNDGIWNEIGATLKVVILPAWWETWWFKGLIVLLISGLIALWFITRTRLLRDQKKLLEQTVIERTLELSVANQELQEKNVWISEQNEEIVSQYQQINNKNEEITQQKEMLEEQKSKVEVAYEELRKYRDHLEELVDERTQELIYAKEKAEESDHLKSSFLANLSHEIRTPLNAIIGFSHLLLDVNIDITERNSYNSIIEGSSNTLLSLISDIIDFSKIEAEKLEIIPIDFKLSEVFNDLEQIYRLEVEKQIYAHHKDIKLSILADKDMLDLAVYTDGIRLKQILTNLINNAIKFTNQGYVEVGCKIMEDNKMLEFYVKDTGIGISKEYQDIIFMRFRKVEDDVNNVYRGAGLGLTITKHLVELLGGNIRVDSEPSVGSTFYFTLPYEKRIIDITSVQKVPKQIEVPDLSRFKILVAEDDLANFLYLQKLIQKTKAQVIHATNGYEAIELYKANPDVSIVLLDIKMPVMDGNTACIKIHELNPDITILAQTAYAFADEINRIMKSGFSGYLLKPISNEELYIQLKKFLLT